jgi:hypothetical protein
MELHEITGVEQPAGSAAGAENAAVGNPAMAQRCGGVWRVCAAAELPNRQLTAFSYGINYGF